MPNQAVAATPACLFCSSTNTGPAATQMHWCFDCGMLWSSCAFNPEIYEDPSKVEEWKLRAGTDVARRIALFRLGLVAVHIPRGGRILDIGCGTGDFVGTASTQMYEAVGADPSPAMREVAKQNLAQTYFVAWGHRRVLPDLPLGTWDAITLFDVIEHLELPWVTLDLLGKQLAPGGVLVIVTPDLGEANRQETPLEQWRHYKPEEHLWLFTPQTLRAVLARASFEVISEGWDESFVRRDGDRKNLMHVVARRAAR